jgi:hypothetical protein
VEGFGIVVLADNPEDRWGGNGKAHAAALSIAIAEEASDGVDECGAVVGGVREVQLNVFTTRVGGNGEGKDEVPGGWTSEAEGSELGLSGTRDLLGFEGLRLMALRWWLLLLLLGGGSRGGD